MKLLLKRIRSVGGKFVSEFVIESHQLDRYYGSLKALDKVNIHVKKGSIYGLIGDNGAGKSTLLKLIAGHQFVTSGDLFVLGEHERRACENVRQRMGFMIETPSFFQTMTLENTLKYYAIQKGIADPEQVEAMLQLTGIEHKRKSKCKQLSYGQKQRLGLAIAMMSEPEILVLDEPINGLDPSGMIEFRQLLKRLNLEKNITILISSHILSELEQIATDYGFLYKGKLLEEITSKSLSEKCEDCIEIKVSDINRYALLIENLPNKEHYRVIADGIMRIYKPLEKPVFYSQLAAQNDIYILGMQTLASSLEDYYMTIKMRGEKNA